MVSFARARTRSWLSKLFPVSSQSIKAEKIAMDIPKELFEEQQEQNKCFLDTTMNGGFWFS